VGSFVFEVCYASRDALVWFRQLVDDHVGVFVHCTYRLYQLFIFDTFLVMNIFYRSTSRKFSWG
jgi:hypothetical protein